MKKELVGLRIFLKMWRNPETQKALNGKVELEVTALVDGQFYGSEETHHMILDPSHPNLWLRISEKLLHGLQNSWDEIEKSNAS